MSTDVTITGNGTVRYLVYKLQAHFRPSTENESSPVQNVVTQFS